MTTKGLASTSLVAGLVLLCISPAFANNLVVNGDFETGNLTGWVWTPTAYAEPMMTTEVVTFNTLGTGESLSFRVNSGKNIEYEEVLIGGGTLSQVVNFIADTEYEITVNAAMRTVLSLPNTEGGSIKLMIDNDTSWYWSVGWMEGDTTVRDSYSGTYIPSSSGEHEISLTFLRSFGNYGTTPYPTPRIYHYVDDIAIVPEPATLSLLALGGLVLLRRRAKS